MPRRDQLIDYSWLVAVGLASSFLCDVAANRVGVTFDEPTYLRLGLEFWHTGSHRELMKLGTMPLPVDAQTLPIAICEWWRGDRFDIDRDFSRLIVGMRYGNLVFWWLLLYWAMQLGRDLGGRLAGNIAVTAVALEPNLLAHAALATTDIAVTGALLGFTVTLLRGRGGAWRQRVGWPGVWCGIALLAKASALAFCPIIMVTSELIRWIQVPDGTPWRRRIWALFRDGFGIAVIGFAIAFAICGSDFQRNDWFVSWAQEQPDGQIRNIMVWLADHMRIFGNAGEALANQVHHNLRGHGQFLFGEASLKPFAYYFPVLFAVKMTLPVLLALAWVLFVRPRELLRNPALAIFLALLAFSVNCRVQLGIRLQFPAVALLITGLAAAIAHAWPIGLRRYTLATAGLTTMAWTTAAVFPHGLSYANRLWENDRSYLLFGDSNFDWGQGLRELDAWHRRHDQPGLDVWYFGRDPCLKSMPVRDLPLHCLPLTKPKDLHQYLWGRKLAVSTSVRYGHAETAAHRVALQFLAERRPVDRTRTFLIYDMSDIGPPVTAAAAEAAP